MRPEFLMQLALDAAWQYQGLTFPNPAVGCTVCGPKGEILGIGAHERAGAPHAEVNALKAAYRLLSGDTAIESITESEQLHDYLKTHHNGLFENCTLYVTLEPCAHHGKTPSCALLIKELGLKKVVIAHEDPNAEAAGGAMLLKDAGVEVQTGLLREKAHDLLLPFIKWQEEHFIFFKWAQRLDGTVDGGTISCEVSRGLVHAMRDVCDLMVIGGNTVKTDRPTLDARMVNGKAPDVLIYSRDNEFDKTIPLFAVEGRKVIISDSLDAMSDYKNVMVEGGPGMFEAVQSKVDYCLSFVAPKSGGTIPFAKSSETFEIMYSNVSGNDLMIWLKPER
ncbi:MAG: bifunctional diaminohydroxyphosphoribosylaminopyrimidine deaminase/5-amino-6-(5-phosphoribosylamino)uracil reductase RibD [Sulfurimonadaceae bacterium]|nr:bifunctional diaminohydroxyphosphoribosylaminopyrimidine deaminase/5-amino-6-(5-phosphoribosylamino)uracil reductase RibD [Sulfurimonadaceae bacterium]